jgi:hypothetical protein
MIEWLRGLRFSRLRWTLWRWQVIARYCFTGDCGLACGMAPFHRLDGTQVDLFVPEADCPIHDDPAKYLSLLEWLRTLLFLVREFCWTLWEAGPPVDWDEQCDEAVGG